MDAKQLESIIKLKEARVGVFGLGYVGLPLAVEITKVGFTTLGADIDHKKLELLNAGINPLSDMTLDISFPRLVEKKIISFDSPENVAQKSDIKIICVPTPSRNKSPDLTFVRSVAKYIGKYVKRGDLIINESTVGPGMTRKILCSVLESESGLTAGTDFFVVASPERIDPGNPIHLTNIPKVIGGINKDSTELAAKFIYSTYYFRYISQMYRIAWINIPKVIGGINKDSTELAAKFYSTLMNSVVKVSSLETAEMVKMLENSFRALNIGFANELAKFCDEAEIDIKEVIDAAATKPYGFMPHYPGIGVGGHCIPEDPYYLISAGEDINKSFPLLQKSLETNESMPEYTLQILNKTCKKLNLKPSETKVVVFGLAYKRDIKDMRLSPALIFHNLVQNEGFDVKVYDEFFSKDEIIKKNLQIFNPDNDECHIAVVGCDHTHIRNFNFQKLKNLKFILDGKNILVDKHVPVVGIGVGRSTVKS